MKTITEKNISQQIIQHKPHQSSEIENPQLHYYTIQQYIKLDSQQDNYYEYKDHQLAERKPPDFNFNRRYLI